MLIPPTYLDKPVTAILDNAFAGANIKSVLISENITSIAGVAFSDCYTLEAIDVDPLNTAYSSIDGNLYDKLGTKLIRYASGKTAASFTTPASVTEIAAEAFSGCNSITSVSIGASVNVIGERAFAYCPSLSDITVSSSNSKFSSKNGSLYNKNGTTLIAYAGSAKSFTVPSGVTEIGAYSFMNCTKLEAVTFSNTVEVIGTAAFKGCTSLIKATLSDSVTVIESYAFADCIKLSEITLGELINTVGDYAFSGCSSLAVVNYNNFEEEFKEINISKSGNAPLTSATKNYLKNDEVSDGVVGDTPIIGA